ncbi:MAG: hypothetical protein ABI969_13335 [bacterium]
MNWRPARLTVCAAVAVFPGLSACAQTPPAVAPKPATTPATPAIVAADTTGAALIPAGFGSLQQVAISVSLQLPDVIVRLTPLDEGVIRTLSSDSYRALRELAESHKSAISRLVAQHGLLRGSLWYVNYYGLARDAKFSPLDLTITSAGRDFRPVEIVPLSSGFGEQRLQPRETQTALYLFDDALDVNQPLVVSLGTQRSSSWSDRLRDIERERVLIRSRAQSRIQTP